MDQEAKWGVTSVKYIKQGWQENFPVHEKLHINMPLDMNWQEIIELSGILFEHPPPFPQVSLVTYPNKWVALLDLSKK